MEYRPEIDGLRALAVVPVILYHAGFQLFSGGFVGVDIFFVISGYLITSIILAEMQAGSFTLLRFYERRARRILPALFTVMLVSFPVAWLWLLPEDLKYFCESMVAVCGFSSNLLFFIKSGYFDTSAELIPLLHTWSLSLEEQYYMLFPIFLMLTRRIKLRQTVFFLAVMAIVSLCIAEYGSKTNQSFAFFLLPARAWELLTGVFVAFYHSKNNHKIYSGGLFREIASLTGLLLILFAVFWFNKSTPFPGLWALVPTIGTALIILFASDHTRVCRLLRRKVLVMIGLMSYSAYLWHQPVFAFARHRNLDELHPALMGALLISVAILAFLTWKYVEIPFRDRCRFSASEIFRYAVLCSAICIVPGLVGHANTGYAYRVAPKHLPKNYYESAKVLRVALKGLDGNKCISEVASMGRVNIEEGATRILLVGDSHSADYSAEFQKYVRERKLDAWQFSVGGCGFLPSQSSRGGECGKARILLQEAIERNNFDKIIFIGDIYGHTRCSEPKVVSEDMDSLFGLIKQMVDSDAEVILFTPRYSLSGDPMRAAMVEKLGQIRVAKEHPLDLVNSKMMALTRLHDLTIFNERDILVGLGCGEVSCFNGHTPDMQPLYRDTNHLTNYGARLVFQQLTSLVRL